MVYVQSMLNTLKYLILKLDCKYVTTHFSSGSPWFYVRKSYSTNYKDALQRIYYITFETELLIYWLNFQKFQFEYTFESPSQKKNKITILKLDFTKFKKFDCWNVCAKLKYALVDNCVFEQNVSNKMR